MKKINLKAFFRSFYGMTEKNEGSAQKKFSWANFYNRKKFLLWVVISLVAAVVATVLLGISANDFVFFFILFLSFLGMYLGYCAQNHDKNDSCYQKDTIFFIWSLMTFAIYAGCCYLFVKQDLVPLHITGAIIGTIVSIIFTLFLPPISYVLKLTSDDKLDEEKKEVGNEEEESGKEKPNFPTKQDRKMHVWLILIVTISLSLLSVAIILNDNKNLKNKKQELKFEQKAFKDITNKTFIVKDDNWFGDDVYAIIETSDEVVAINVVDHPEICTATKVKVLINDSIIINKNKYPTSDKIEFETPAPE